MKSLFALLSLLIAASLQGQPVPRCSEGFTYLTVNSGQDVTFSVTPIAGATRYRLQIASRWSVIAPNNFLMYGTILDRSFFPGTPIRETLYTTSNFTDEIYAVVIAEVDRDDGSRFYCSQDFLVDIQPDPILGRNATRAVVPVAGSIHGANNSVFKTRLVLENRFDVGKISGRVVFHRQGVPGLPSDPSLSYGLDPHTFITIDDVVGALQLDGVIGSLDIVPDAAPSGAYPLPQVRADLLSLTPTGGEFSASIPVVTSTSGYAGALVGSPRFLIEGPHNKRINVGVRSLAEPVEITAFLLASDRTERARVTRNYAADFYEQTPLGSWFNVEPLPGDSILFFIRPTSGAVWTAGAIVFFAETDNTTNDVTIVSPTDLGTLAQPFVVCSEGAGCAVVKHF